jgi:hypothetical protein
MNTWKDEVHFDVLPLDLLKEQLQENILSYMDTVQSQFLDIDRNWVYDDLCQVVVNTFRELEV